MIKLTRKTDTTVEPDTTLTLPLHSRIKSRLRVTLDNGEDAGLFLERGTTLKEGDQLSSEEGYRVQIKAAVETLSIIRSDDPHLLARACYHLGNRHVSIQIESNSVSFLHDHVLDGMLRGLGLTVEATEAPFEPEPGAYGGSAEKGNHDHSHGHGHDHHH
ncbi:MAG: urease accessory protein UreE [Gammaproteobacteria bacterium]|nr:urease accessory protein UreE [Gammaproteobacteria bacterium]MCP5407172.1 urease accessory protein UreE [Chromatiaceae bacterium]MCP5408270.1 urease accessory protein UreE [Chromatiaceae bacterium]MCP5442084.1 urease accessory protein UreE [Chromatiaceae bacterium]